MTRLHYLAALLYTGLCVVALGAARFEPRPVEVLPQVWGGSAGPWFQSVRPFCNGVEVELTLRRSPPPSGLEGAGYAAACLALAGRIDPAREWILSVHPAEQYRAAGIVFRVGHPVADAGDDRAAGPIMDLVLEFWPNHYMALYHAGMANFALGDQRRAAAQLSEFLELYKAGDVWSRNARSVLRLIAYPPAAPEPGSR